MRILIVEDDASAARSAQLVLRGDGAVVDVTDSGEEALGLVRHYEYDIVILDLILPDMMGADVVRRLRAARIEVPIIIVSTQSHIASKIQLLSLGADDYMIKPFDSVEFLERVRAVIRRSRGFCDSELKIGPISLNFSLKRVKINDSIVHLTGKEYAILELLVLRRGAVLTKEAFLNLSLKLPQLSKTCPW